MGLLVVIERGKRKRPGFHQFLVQRLGEPRHVVRFVGNWFLRPLCAPSFPAYWRYWNPVYGYVLLFYVYRPLRRFLPRPAAVCLTFLVSGFLLHDLPFSLSADLARGKMPVPAVTILFAIFGAFALIGEALHINLSRRPAWVRAAANLCWLGAGFALRKIIVAALQGTAR